MARLHALLFLAALAHLCLLALSQRQSVCELSYCECSPALHPTWTVVNCTVPSDKQLDILEGDLPNSTTELLISGAEAVRFDAHSLSALSELRHVAVSGARVLLLRRGAAVALNVVHLVLDVHQCDTIRIEDKAFSNLKGPLSVTISECQFVSLDSEPFSWLLKITVEGVRQLRLSPGTFTLDAGAANIGQHGPGMVIELKNSTVPQFPSQTFGSSAALILLHSVSVEHIYADAFIANTYNVVMAINCSFSHVHAQAFAQKSLINSLYFDGCKVRLLSSNALQSAVSKLNISHSTFENIETGAVNVTVATVIITDSEFNVFSERAFELAYCNSFLMERNSFDELGPDAIIAPGATIHELVFVDNEIETLHDNSLGFIGQAQLSLAEGIKYKKNYYGQACYCDIAPWLAKVMGAESGDSFVDQSFCTINEFFARCFNVPEQNMLVKQFVDGVCNDGDSIKCLPFQDRGAVTPEIKNPRFPHARKEKEALSDRNKKVIGIVVVTVLGCLIIVLLISLIKWMKRKGYCRTLKNFLERHSSCFACLCCHSNRSGIDNAGSISQIAVHEYSERQRLNDPRVEVVQETALPRYTQDMVPTDDKQTQTLPEELTKELLESLKDKLDDPENYVEAREMIEHLYELIKVEESCNSPRPTLSVVENVYELPFQNTAPRLGKNKKQMKSIGTRTPSLDKLTPISPYNRQTALAHEYFEPKDFAIHLYAEIANNDRRPVLNIMPDVVGEQALLPRGPYLDALREKNSSSSSSSSSPTEVSQADSLLPFSPGLKPRSAVRSNESSPSHSNSNSSGKMINRPLPEKPTTTFDTGQGPSAPEE
ncbi:hypothetical protein JYU34_000493 [Plutella xylostella]|uniref:Uncharacterized protein n=1 Tax=Plutella xylostella TaxID=51655 RepID=A0ABQ7R828_PLUXY|nr:hypothetical protein JYU34_000493 [Plutella xylostella]